jgi:uncharacterized protein (DUF2141 family)
MKFASNYATNPNWCKDASFEFSDIKPGKYAIAVIHDENCNGELDSNLFGIPTEGYGFPVAQKSQWVLLRFLMLYFHMKEDIFKCLYLLTIKF